MTYEQIKEKITEDYNSLVQISRLSRYPNDPKRVFYMNLSRALKELHNAVGPFTLSKEDFIEQVRYKKEVVSSEVYKAIITYCEENLKLEVE